MLAIKENYLTADTVKDVLQISETTLWRWAKAGYLLPVMIGGQKRYKQSDIEKMVEQGYDYSGLNVPLVAVCNVPPIAFSNVPPQKWLL